MQQMLIIPDIGSVVLYGLTPSDQEEFKALREREKAINVLLRSLPDSSRIDTTLLEHLSYLEYSRTSSGFFGGDSSTLPAVVCRVVSSPTTADDSRTIASVDLLIATPFGGIFRNANMECDPAYRFPSSGGACWPDPPRIVEPFTK